jgi:hypothetical protein
MQGANLGVACTVGRRRGAVHGRGREEEASSVEAAAEETGVESDSEETGRDLEF